MPPDLEVMKSLVDDNKESLGFVLRPILSRAISSGRVMVATVPANGTVGFVNYRHRSDAQTTIYEICVHEAFRCMGIGAALITALVQEASSSGSRCIRLKAPADIPANEFYRSLGFQFVGKEQGRRRLLNIWQLTVGEQPECR